MQKPDLSGLVHVSPFFPAISAWAVLVECETDSSFCLVRCPAPIYHKYFLSHCVKSLLSNHINENLNAHGRQR